MAKPFTIPLENGGTITVNANSMEAALDNVRSTGNTPASSGGGSSAPAQSAQTGTVNLGGDEPVYNTINGPKTNAQMLAELQAAGWQGSASGINAGSIANAYAQTAGGNVVPANSAALSQTGNAQATALGVTPQQMQAMGGGAEGDLGGAIQGILDAIASGNAQAFAEQVRQFDLEHGLDVKRFDEAIRQYNQSFGLSEAAVTGTYQGAPTLAAQAEQNKTALGYLGLIGSLRGPADYGQYLRVLGSTPGGLRDLVASAAGRYAPATGATTGVAAQPASLGGLVNAAATGASGGTTYGQYMQTAQGLPAPNQIAPAAWNSYTDTQKQLLLGMYESNGYRPQDVLDLYKQSLPKYSYSGSGAVQL